MDTPTTANKNKIMISLEETERVKEYLQKHPQGEVSDLSEQGFENEVIEILKSLHFIAVSKRYRVTKYGERFIHPVVVPTTPL